MIGVLNSIQKIPLRLILVVPFVVQVTIAVGLTGWISLRNGQKAVNELAVQLSHDMSLRIGQHLDAYLTVPPTLNQLNVDTIQLGVFNLNDLPTLGRYFWKQMQLFNVGYNNFANSEGEFIGVERLDNGELLINELSNETGNRLVAYATNSEGDRTTVVDITDNYDPRAESWYVDAIQAGKPIWSQIYSWDDKPDILSISASYPIYDEARRPIGVIGVDLILSQIHDFLSHLEINPSGRTFVLERNGLLVASSATAPPFRIVNNRATRLRATDSGDPLIDATAHYLTTHFVNLSAIDKEYSHYFFFNGEQQFVQVTPWHDKFGLDWLIVVVIPEADFMTQIHANTRTTVLLCMAALMVAILVGLLTSRWLTQPIARLSRASQAIARGELDQRIDEQIPVEELGVMARSFNQMAYQLQEAFDGVQVALRESEAKFTKAFRCSPSGIKISTLAEGRYLEVNDSFCRVTGYRSEEVVGKTALELNLWVNPDDRLRIDQQLQHQRAVYNQELDFRIQSGEVRTSLLSAEVVNLLGQECVLTIMNDISDRKQAEVDILNALSHEKKLSEMKSQFVTIVSHEFRTPLTTIQSAAELLEYYEWSGEERRERFRQIKTAVKHMTQLLEDVLLVGKIEAGKLEPKLEVLDLMQLCQDVIEENQLTIDDDHEIVLIREGEPHLVWLDGKLVRQILNNLLSNAVKYSPHGGQIKLMLIYLPDQVILKVQDRGIGIPAETQKILFQPFQRATNVSNIQGTGLGLAIVKKCVDLQKGHVSVTSIIGEGTTFVVTFPLKQPLKV